MYIDVEFRAVLLSRKETDYKFDDGKEVTGYKLGIMYQDECGMIKCTQECLPEEVEFFKPYLFRGGLDTDKGTFLISYVVSVK